MEREKMENGKRIRTARRKIGAASAAIGVLVMGLAREAGAQIRTTPDQDREYVERGTVDRGAHRTARPENQLQARNGVSAHVTGDSLYIQSLHRECLLSICGGCFPSAWKTYALPLPGGPEALPPALGLLEAGLDGNWGVNTTVVIGRSDGTLLRVRIRAGQGPVETRTESHVLPEAGERRIRAIGGLEHLGDPDFLVLGLGGLAFRVRVDAAGRMAHERLGLMADGNVLAYGRGFAGTDRGRILEIVEANGALAALPANAPGGDAIARIDDVSAVTASGHILWRDGRAWQELATGGAADGAVRTFTREGISFLPYRDGIAGTPVTYDRKSMAHVTDRGGLGMVRGLPFYLSYDGRESRVVTVVLQDPDRNMEAPHLNWIWSDIAEPIGREFVAADPSIGCAGTGVCLPGGSATLTVRLHPDSFTVSVPVLRGTWSEEPVCRRPGWQGDSAVFSRTVKWSRGTAFHLWMGNSEVIIEHGQRVSVRHAPAVSERVPQRAGSGSRFLALTPSGSPVDASGREARPRRISVP